MIIIFKYSNTVHIVWVGSYIVVKYYNRLVCLLFLLFSKSAVCKYLYYSLWYNEMVCYAVSWWMTESWNFSVPNRADM